MEFLNNLCHFHENFHSMTMHEPCSRENHACAIWLFLFEGIWFLLYCDHHDESTQ